MSTTHTKYPELAAIDAIWEHEHDPGSYDVATLGRTVAHVNNKHGNAKDYAVLFAAAPELLDMLKQVLMRLDLEPVEAVFPCSAMRHDIRAALAKAEPHA